ncbi:MAG: hypothetical protein UU24_C0005G0046 [Candidatus Nomurabacteria bacterium GW2011_GWA2_40_9]|uniref:Addiction module toxin, RelE/StbE family n=1 Tax=Candidatus Nomurabacteria bacterium GW2011_GWA2_40_9 TaxID=1618734 RepID=A0A0G0TRP1_9BACT|nr:MAG: hypothetical protein UU24_C0005G0046 [Candidatus Nomurabacteria bacterium GW2011_GWA2_40_9]
MLSIIESKKYKKSLKLYMQNKNFDVSKLEKIIELIQKRIPLDAKYHDHKLKGQLEGIRECHIYPNILLLYKILDKELILLLVDIGSHPKFF